MTATLPHLSGPSRGARQALAAHHLRGVRHIIEIGGAFDPITNHLLDTPESVTVIDPKIAPLERDALNGAPCRVRHVAAKLQRADLTPPDGDYAVVFLGLSLKPLGTQGALTDALLTLLRGAGTVIIEYSVTLERAAAQWSALVAAAGHGVVIEIDLDIRDGVIEQAGFGRRRLLVLRHGARAGGARDHQPASGT